MPPRDSTATSVVPPPISTTIEPVGSVTGRPAPIAAAIGSSMRKTRRAAALSAGFLVGARAAPAAGAGALGRFLDGAALDRGRARGHADDDLRRGEAAPVVNLADEMLDHFL